MTGFNAEIYENIYNQITSYLEQERPTKNIILYGIAGEGKTTMLNELRGLLESKGYQVHEVLSDDVLKRSHRHKQLIAATTNEIKWREGAYDFTDYDESTSFLHVKGWR